MTEFDFSQNKFFSALALGHYFPKKLRYILTRVLETNLVIFFCLLLLGMTLERAFSPLLLLLPLLPAAVVLLGVFTILLAMRLIIFSLEAFIYSKTFDKQGSLSSGNTVARFNYFAAECWYEGAYLSGARSLAEFLSSLNKSIIGSQVLLRLGISNEEFSGLRELLKNEHAPLLETFLEDIKRQFPAPVPISFTELLLTLCESSSTLKKFSLDHQWTEETIRGAAEWVEEEAKMYDLWNRWWGKERLSRISGLAKDWAYGEIPFLEKFAHDLSEEAFWSGAALVGKGREVELLETALLKKNGANVLIVGEPGTGKHTVLLGLTRMIMDGKIFSQLEHWRVFKLRGAELIATGKTNKNTGALLVRLLNEAVRAGNIILSIDEFPEFVDSLEKDGVSAMEIFEPYLLSSAIHIVGLANTISFRKILENNTGLLKYFERIEITEPKYKDLIEILKDLVPQAEARQRKKVIMTYAALQKIAEGAENFLVTGALPKRAVDLMEEVFEDAIHHSSFFVTPNLVMEWIEQKTHMPLGAITKEEQQKLLGLEDLLHKRVVNQKEAIGLIADSIRRARSGIQNQKKPIGTFLFLGPTGVGKTETAKALAEVYFGHEENLFRLDMSEYQNEDGILRLTGSFEKNEPGLLASRMRSSPYNVVLLDEFEKTHEKVKNLFLQILDEGFFSDYLGGRVNMRNTIIIATSNAGALVIAEYINNGLEHTTLRDVVLTHIQKEKIFSPELLNRFDAIVIYQPLDHESQRAIAHLLLTKVASRLKQQNMIFSFTEDLVEATASGGYDQVWGARPMQRFIQNRIEKIISEKIIKGEIKPGSEFSLSREEISS